MRLKSLLGTSPDLLVKFKKEELGDTNQALQVGLNQPHPSQGGGVFPINERTLFMPIIKIDNIDYDTDKLSDEAKAQLASIQFCDQELARLKAQAAAYQTARMAYAKALKEALPKEPVGDTLKFS